MSDDQLAGLGPIVRHVSVRVANVRSSPWRAASNIVRKIGAGVELVGVEVEGEEVDGDRRWLMIANAEYVHGSVVSG
jgi:hypothetical protein